MKIIEQGLTFDDVLLLPQYSEILPKDVDTTSFLTRKIKLKIPLLSSAMDTVTESDMAIALAKHGGIGIIHKSLTISGQAEEIIKVKKCDSSFLVGAAVGTSDDTKERVKTLVDSGVDVIVVDTAHGHSKKVIDVIIWIKENYSSLQVIGGNIATYKAAKALVKAGVDAVKVGIGPGSICTTRIVSGVGVPQITAIKNVADALKSTDVKLIADGGIKFSGDIVKAIAAGADTVMMGSMFAGTLESPGEIILDKNTGKQYKSYRGMGSIGAMASSQSSKDRYFQHDTKEAEKLVPEGIEGRLDYKGSVEPIIYQLVGGLRSGMGYLGAKNFQELYDKSEFVQLTAAGMQESHVHSVTITKDTPNYQIGNK